MEIFGGLEKSSCGWVVEAKNYRSGLRKKRKKCEINNFYERFNSDLFHFKKPQIIFFIHPSVSGHLGCFHVLAIVNSVAVSTRVHVSFELWFSQGLPWSLSGKESACNAGDSGNTGSIPESRRSPGRGNCTPLQYSCLENPKDRGSWWATVLRVIKSSTWLSAHTHTHTHIKTHTLTIYMSNSGIAGS